MPALPPPAGPDVRTGRAPSRWPLALLTASLGLVILATVVAGLSTRKHGATTVQLLRDYAAFAAWSYSQRIAEDLGEGAWFTLNPIQHSASSDRIKGFSFERVAQATCRTRTR